MTKMADKVGVLADKRGVVMAQGSYRLILDLLRVQSEPLSIGEILNLLGPSFKERSVRRWLGELVELGDVIKTGTMRSTRYQIAEQVEQSNVISIPAIKSLQYIRQPLFERAPVSYNQQWLDEYIPNQSTYLTLDQMAAMADKGRRETNHEPAGTYAHKIFNRLMIDLSFNSSRLEGNTYSLLETERLLLEGSSAHDKLNIEKIMILNHKEAIRYIVEKTSSMDITTDEICTIHYLLSEGLIEKKYSGKIRDHGVRVSATTYIPYEDQKRLEQLLQKICHKAQAIQSPFEQSFFLLTHLAYLQAFEDVNKRTSRLCANIPLIKGNFVPLSFSAVSKEDYIDAMICIYELNDPRPLAELYSNSYARSCQLYDASVEALGFDRIQIQYRNERRGLIRKVIVENIPQAKLQEFIALHARALIPQDDFDAFVDSVITDLDLIDSNRIAGIGISKSQLEHWLKNK